jgi:hypothetical protein
MPCTGVAIANNCAVFILGITKPLLVLSNSNKELAPIVVGLLPILTCENNLLVKNTVDNKQKIKYLFINSLIVCFC